MFGKVFSSPIPKCLAPTTVHHVPTTATAVPSPDAVFHDSVVTPSTLPHCSTITDHAFKGSGQVDAPTPKNFSQCSTTVNHAAPRCFNGTMFGKVFSSPIPKCLAPMTVHHLPATTTVVPSPDAVFHSSVVTPPALPHCSTIKDNALPCQYLGTLFGQDFYSAITISPTPEHDAPPPAAAIVPYALPELHLFTQILPVAVSTPAPNTTFSNHSCFTLPSFILVGIPIFCRLYSRSVILVQPPPKPPHPTSQSQLPNLYSYKLFG
jgi:hypothetical protein